MRPGFELEVAPFCVVAVVALEGTLDIDRVSIVALDEIAVVAVHRTNGLRQRLHVLEGLTQAPVGLGMLFRGENNGKLVVRVAAESV